MNLESFFHSSALTQAVFTVSELSNALKRNVESTFTGIKVRGEISGLKRHTSGHMYYTLKDEAAVLDAVSWRGTCHSGPIQLEDGLEIIAYGRLTTYPQRSKYQFIVERFEATGQGALLKLLEERKQKLAAEGLFDRARKKSIPPFPEIIGVITSPTGAVIRDILHRIQDRFPCHVIVWPVLVQGPDAARQIAEAIEGFQQFTPRPDTLIVARGGGSLEDLWAFNEEIVVRAAANSTLPLISAVGHETDTTLIDYAADLRAPTPTGAAELSVPVLSDLRRHLQDRSKRLIDLAYSYLETSQLNLRIFEKSLASPDRLLEDYRLRLDDWQERLSRALVNSHRQSSERFLYLNARLRPPVEIIHHFQQVYENVSRLLSVHTGHYWQEREKQFQEWSLRLEQASFQKMLERGFVLVSDEKNQPIRSAQSFPKNKTVQLTFKDGKVEVMQVSKGAPSKKPSSDLSLHPKLF